MLKRIHHKKTALLLSLLISSSCAFATWPFNAPDLDLDPPQGGCGTTRYHTNTVPFPTYSADIRYKGLVPGEMNFRRGGNKYTITATMKVPFKKMVFVSTGTLSAGKFQPERYTDTRGDKLYASAQFDYDNQTITYGKTNEDPKTVAMTNNPQDTLSAIWQLALNQGTILEAEPMQITTGKGEIKTYAADTIQSQALDYQTGERSFNICKLTFPNNDKKIAYGFATDYAYFPATMTFDGIELYVDRFSLDDIEYWKATNKASGTNNKKI